MKMLPLMKGSKNVEKRSTEQRMTVNLICIENFTNKKDIRNSEQEKTK